MEVLGRTFKSPVMYGNEMISATSLPESSGNTFINRLGRHLSGQLHDVEEIKDDASVGKVGLHPGDVGRAHVPCREPGRTYYSRVETRSLGRKAREPSAGTWPSRSFTVSPEPIMPAVTLLPSCAAPVR